MATKDELFQRVLARIDRRLQNPAYAGYAVKDALRAHRDSLFAEGGDLDIDNLNHCLRNIDRAVKRRAR